MKSNLLVHKIVYIGTWVLFLAGLGSMDHLTWKEGMRLFVIQIGILWLYFRYRDQILDGEHESESKSLLKYPASVVVALTAAYAITQFDPATSAISYQKSQPRLSFFFLFGSLVSLVMGSAFLVVRWRHLRIRQLTFLDIAVTGVVGFAVAVTFGAKQLIGHGITRVDVLSAVKIASYLFIWFPVTRMYSETVDETVMESGSWTNRIFEHRWSVTLGFICLLCGPALMSVMYRTGVVLHHYYSGQKSLHAETMSTAMQHYKIAQEMNKTVNAGFVRERIFEDMALLHLEKGDYRAAKASLNALQTSIFDKAAAHKRVAETYFRARRWGHAASAYEAFLVQAEKNTEVLDQLAKAYLHLRNAKEFCRIVGQYSYTPNVDANTYDQHVFLGNVYFNQHQYDTSLRHFQAAANLDPKDAYSTYKVGRIHLAKTKYRAAIVEFQKATRLKSDFADAYYQTGVCYELQERLKEAVEMYQKAVDLLPNHLDGLMALERIRGLN